MQPILDQPLMSHHLIGGELWSRQRSIADQLQTDCR